MDEEFYLDQHPLARVPNWGHCNLPPPVVEGVELVRFHLQELHRYHRRQLNAKQYTEWYLADLLQWP